MKSTVNDLNKNGLEWFIDLEESTKLEEPR